MSSIKDIKKIGGHLKSLLLVKNCDEGVASNSKPYLNIVFQDLTGTLDGKKWDIMPGDVEALAPGSVAEVEGDVFMYRNNMQMKVTGVRKVDQTTVDLKDFVAASPLSLEEMKKDLEEALGRIEDAEIKKLTSALIEENYERYTSFPAAMSFHHSFYGGILYHSLSIEKMAEVVAEKYPFLSRDYLIAGSLLHDLGKTVELTGNIATTYTDQGKLLGHIAIGADMVFEMAKRLGITGEAPLVLGHMILSHHGQPDFGSPVMPKTAEAYVLHVLDDLDSKMDMLKTALNAADPGEYTAKLAGFDGRQFYKVHH